MRRDGTAIPGGEKPVLLVVDDRWTVREALATAASREFRVETAGSALEALRVAARVQPDVALVDMLMPGMSGIEMIRLLPRISPGTAIVAMSGVIEGPDTAAAALRAGALKFVEKDFGAHGLRDLLRETLATCPRTPRGFGGVDAPCNSRPASREVLGRHGRFLDCIRIVERAAGKGLPILLEGETGTGKDLLARLVHACGQFRDGPFFAVNCGSLNRELARSELFGHEKGAFTGAVERRAGAFELSHGGTLLLNEIGDLPAEVQVDLLQVLDEKRWSRLGGSESFLWRAGLVCATNVDLDGLVSRGAFRRDLFHRVKGQRVRLPPLRERRGDVRFLAVEFLRRAGPCGMRFGAGVLDAFDAYPWPGNVRELEGEVVRAAALAQGPEVALSDISPEIRKPAPGAAVAGKGILHVLAGEKSRRAEEALLQAGGCQRGAARMLDMDPSSFRRMCRRLGLPLGPGAPELMDSGGTDERTAQRCQSRRRQPAADSLVQPGRVEPPAEGRR